MLHLHVPGSVHWIVPCWAVLWELTLSTGIICSIRFILVISLINGLYTNPIPISCLSDFTEYLYIQKQKWTYTYIQQLDDILHTYTRQGNENDTNYWSWEMTLFDAYLCADTEQSIWCHRGHLTVTNDQSQYDMELTYLGNKQLTIRPQNNNSIERSINQNFS